ncbi:MAG: TRAM domain-containing protein, partial [Anaerolineaceae bacterium]|nr:TRAM domain-containing protein [Anaerolineaceae bacterium]
MIKGDVHTYDVVIDTLVYGGDGIGRLSDGRAVFVPFVLPGERVRVRSIAERRGHVRAELVEVLEASPERIAPRCPHFGACGGCHYQHIPYARQLEIKTEILREQFQRIAGIAAPPLRPMTPSPQEWHYRNSAQLHLTPEGKPGYMKPGSNQVCAIQQCYLLDPALNAVIGGLEIEPLPGLEKIELRVGSDGEILLILHSQDPQPPEMEMDMPISVVHLGPDGPY